MPNKGQSVSKRDIRGEGPNLKWVSVGKSKMYKHMVSDQCLQVGKYGHICLRCFQ